MALGFVGPGSGSCPHEVLDRPKSEYLYQYRSLCVACANSYGISEMSKRRFRQPAWRSQIRVHRRPSTHEPHDRRSPL